MANFHDSSSSDDDLFLLALMQNCKRRRHWVHPINKSRKEEGEYYTLYPRLREDPERFYGYFRMLPEQFDYILSKIEADLMPQQNNWRDAIYPEQKLAVTLR